MHACGKSRYPLGGSYSCCDDMPPAWPIKRQSEPLGGLSDAYVDVLRDGGGGLTSSCPGPGMPAPMHSSSWFVGLRGCQSRAKHGVAEGLWRRIVSRASR